MLNLWSTYELPMRLTVGGGVNYSDGNFFNQTGSFNFVGGGTVSQPKYATNAAAIQALTKYWVFDAMASYPVNRHLTLAVEPEQHRQHDSTPTRPTTGTSCPAPARQILFSPVFSF